VQLSEPEDIRENARDVRVMRDVLNQAMLSSDDVSAEELQNIDRAEKPVLLLFRPQLEEG
jgi:hypothetical protein